jgi:REP element-mobilizing transposase RayT
MGHTYTNLVTHFIFSTKDRVEHLQDREIRERAFAYLGGIVREMEGVALIVNGAADHAHVLTVTPASLAPAELMRVVKTNSSKWIHETFPELSAFAWQAGYGAFSVSESNVPQVQKYVAGQEEHHKTVTFQEEFLAFLKRHRIQYDERYVWQ